ncbi:ribosomal RNA processing (Rrp15p) related protein [Nitzschia inconspicua]|uniref:Ribosomal RNA processing (Rrp15p) related protein n=1 Tax=Nitzschia inconspicua TaxID=303405 RepID=A0A9K3Q837_9STRA|nr:ribosomal RNA processing (Rrp15p) related protein [Nitzschia inconspicua]
MAKKGGKRKQKKIEDEVAKEGLDRFAGSSDEEGGEVMAPPAPVEEELHDADVEIDTEDEDEEENVSDSNEDKDPKKYDTNGDDSSTSSIEKEADPALKMANVMGRILGGDNKKKKAPTTSVVLGKTVTPLQKMQQEEKDRLKALKKKRQSNRERNLSAMHYPLSIATSSNVQTDGRLSVARELEQERFHRRVATRGVVALFNAISQHQRSNTQKNVTPSSSKTIESSKMTKHSFLDKIKSAAKSQTADNFDSKKRSVENEGRESNKETKSNTPSWGALKDDYMLNPKKNWDEESSEEEADPETIQDEADKMEQDTPRKKLRVRGRQ